MKKEAHYLSTVTSLSLVKFVVLLSAFFVTVNMSSCQKSQLEDYITEEVWMISSKTEKKTIREFNEMNLECMIVSKIIPFSSDLFFIPLGRIDGFEYQSGYRYTIKVQVVHLADPPQDSSNVIYKLKSVLSKEKVE